MWQIIVGSMAALPQKDSATLAALDELMCAGLTSSHRTIVNTSIDFWNNSFGRQDELDYPTSVAEALHKLRCLADLQLPTFPIATQDESQVPPSFFDSQEDPTQHAQALPTPKLGKSSRPSANPSTRDSKPKASKTRTPKKKTPKSKLRHDNSQLQFASIDSSPIDASGDASQLMTEHQKEVQEKQRQMNGAMFRDIGSSSSVPLSESSPDASRLNIMTTNMVASKESAGEGYMGSSPTPTPHRRSQSASSGRRRKANMDPPSSPPRSPQQHADLFEDLPLASDDVAKDSFECSTSNASEQQFDTSEEVANSSCRDQAEDHSEDQLISISGDEQDETMGLGITSSEADALLHAQIAKEMDARTEQTTLRSVRKVMSNDEFVDAPSEPITSDDIDEAEFVDASPEISLTPDVAEEACLSIADEHDCPDVSHIEDSFVVNASSQLDPSDGISPRRLRRDGRKRKSEDSTPASIAKKAKREAPSTSQTNNVQVSQAGAVESAAVPRKRGRPRKNKAATPSEVSTAYHQTLTEMEIDSRDHMSQDLRRSPFSLAPSDAEPAASTVSQRRVAVAVAPTPPLERKRKMLEAAIEEGTTAQEPEGENEKDVATGAPQLCPSTTSRRILQPKSIMDRLKGLLTDIKSFAFGSVEEYHEADRMVTEMRTELFQAS